MPTAPNTPATPAIGTASGFGNTTTPTPNDIAFAAAAAESEKLRNENALLREQLASATGVGAAGGGAGAEGGYGLGAAEGAAGEGGNVRFVSYPGGGGGAHFMHGRSRMTIAGDKGAYSFVAYDSHLVIGHAALLGGNTGPFLLLLNTLNANAGRGGRGVDWVERRQRLEKADMCGFLHRSEVVWAAGCRFFFVNVACAVFNRSALVWSA